MEVVHYQVVHHLQLMGDQAMNTQQHTTVQEAVQQIYTINTEMQLMKQELGIQIARTLWIRAILSSGVEVAITTLILTRVCSTIPTAIGISWQRQRVSPCFSIVM